MALRTEPMRTRLNNRRYWLGGIAAVIVVLILITTLHLGTQISGSAQRTLYRETVDVVTAERAYASANGQYTGWIGDLATTDPKLEYLLGGSTPVVQFNNDDGNHGYFIELANQTTGGAASFSVLMSDNNTAVLTCTGPGPLCSDGTFRLPHQDYALNTESQRELYAQTVAIVKNEAQHAAANHGLYRPYVTDLAAADKRLAFVLGSASPVKQLSTDSADHGYYLQMSNSPTGGSASFSVLVPDQGAAVLTCVGPAPLCTRGTFTLPSGTLGASAAGANK